ncbi:hypothetical protein [Burkholderia sp. JP2-270]|uniref:hypothetical protein n=1 Tax=Burkholderia sp. JP2-270 TaxID=2217913 RepID=UPI0013A6B65A|nr:hypothetical protein [Burkholderia sp. JP2-270]
MEKHNIRRLLSAAHCRLHLQAIKIAANNISGAADTGVAKYQQMAKSLPVTKYPY